MEPTEAPLKIKRTLISHINNVTTQEVDLLQADLTWSKGNPLEVEVLFKSCTPDVEDVQWIIGLAFFQEALAVGSAGDPEGSTCLGEVVGEDFVLKLRGITNGQVIDSHITWSLEELTLFIEEIEPHAGMGDYADEVERLLASLEVRE